jgi:hypothetical protein
LGRVESIRRVGDKTHTQCRLDLCLATEVARLVIRGHGSIENQQPGVLTSGAS